MNNDFNEYKNAFNNNKDSKVTARRGRPTPVINKFPEKDTLGVSKQNKNLIPGYTKYNAAVCFSRKAYVFGTSMIERKKKWI